MTRRGDHFVLKVDPILCDGFGHCHELAPELVHIDEWGYPIMRLEPTSIERAREPTNRPASPCGAVPVRPCESSASSGPS